MENKTAYLKNTELELILKQRGYDFTRNGEFLPLKFNEIAAIEGYEYSKENFGWFK